MNPSAKPPPKAKRFRKFSAALIERVVIFSIVSIAGFLLWSSVSRFSNVRSESRNLSRRIAQLSGEIDMMQSQWPSTRTQQVAHRLTAAAEALFQGPPAIAEWIESVRATAIPLALETDFEFVSARTQSIDRAVAIMQTRVQIAPSRDVDSSRPSYHRLLELGQTIARNPQRLDILELTLHGSSNSVGEASALIEVWSENLAAPTP